jgi:hypothetical protein
LTRDRRWWETVQALQNQYKRRLDGHIHVGLGHRVEWEDVFVQAYGVHWRGKRDSCSTLAQWMACFPDFAHLLCKKFGMSAFQYEGGRSMIADMTVVQMTDSPKRARIIYHPLEKLPTNHGAYTPDFQWDSDSGHFCFVTDCKPLAGILNGHIALMSDDLAPILARVTASLFRLFESGWTPVKVIDDPVTWRKRDWNKIADYIVNYTMDVRRSWYQRFDSPWEGFTFREANLIIHQDGGTRVGNCSAAGWYMEARVVRERKAYTFPLVMAGTFLETPVSSFLAEAIAIEESTRFVVKMLHS